MSDKPDGLFREPAIIARDLGDEDLDPVLRNAPDWTVLTYRILLACLAIAVVFAMVARINNYADGTGVVLLGSDARIVAREAGTVEAVRVASGDWVEAGDVLVELHARRERDQLALAEQNYADAVRRWLLSYQDADQVVQTRSELRRAQAQLEELVVRAKVSGPVNDIRVRAGQPVVAGQVLLTQGAGAGQGGVSLFLPGHYRPRLAPGQMVSLEFPGHTHSRMTLELAHVDGELIGVEEARGRVGFGLGESLELSGALVRAEARLLEPVFVYQGREYPLHDGMIVTAQVLIGSEPLAYALIPGLRQN